MVLKGISDIHDFSGKTVLMRIDTDVDLNGDKISDDTRLQASLETLHYILKHNGHVILLGHLGRPDGKKNSALSQLPIAHWFCEKLHGQIHEKKFNDFSGWQITDSVALLENIRFYPEEESNDHGFAKRLADLGDLYVNEAFAVSHRDHATITGIVKYLPSYAGLHLQQEIADLSRAIKHPKRPLVVLIGGAKLETKLPVVETMHKVADYVLVGGKIAQEQRQLVKVQHESIPSHKSILFVADNTPDGENVTEKDTENFIQIINIANTIIWNGPVGKMGNPETEENTLKIAKAITESGAYTVVGGGDSLAFLQKHHLLDRFSLVSTGGGAMLDFLAGKTLPGIKALEK